MTGSNHPVACRPFFELWPAGAASSLARGVQIRKLAPHGIEAAAWVVGIVTVFVILAILVSPGPLTESDFPDLQNGLGVEAYGRALGEGTAGARVDLWVRIGDELRGDAVWPSDARPPDPLIAAEHAEGSVTTTSMLEPIRNQGELLGALSVEKRPGESMTPTEEKLVRNLATQAGLVMRSVVLTEQLMHTIDELRASRQRLVTAQDEGRRGSNATSMTERSKRWSRSQSSSDC